MPRRPRVPWPVLLVPLPWLWFLLRDVAGAAGDVVAILLPALVAVAALALALARRVTLLPLIVSLLVMGLVAVVAPWRPIGSGPVDPATAVRVASANITGLAGNTAALLADPADVTVLSEDRAEVHVGFAAAYPYAVFGGPVTADVGVYSRFPIQVVQGAGPDLPGLRVRIAAPVPFTLYALHVPRPWYGHGGYQVSAPEHHRIMLAVAAQVAAEPGPVVVAGDLNTSDRTRDYRIVATALTDAMRDDWSGPTSVTTWRLLLLRIDHLLVSRGWCGDDPDRIPLPGSDHEGITARVGPCAVSVAV